MGKKILPRFSLGEEYSSLEKANLPLWGNGQEYPLHFSLGNVGETNFASKEQIFFPEEEKPSYVGKQGRKSFPISPQGKNILP